MFEFPIVDYSEQTEAQKAYQERRNYRSRLEADLKDASKSAKRSPNKWLPVVARIEAVLEAARANEAEAEALVNAEHETARAARNQVLHDALEWAMREIGPVEYFAENDPRMGLRVVCPDEDHDIFFQEQSTASIDILWVKPGTYTIAERMGYIYRPQEAWSRVSEPSSVEPASISLSSASKMTAAEALEFASTVRVASLLAEKMNEAFGL